MNQKIVVNLDRFLEAFYVMNSKTCMTLQRRPKDFALKIQIVSVNKETILLLQSHWLAMLRSDTLKCFMFSALQSWSHKSCDFHGVITEKCSENLEWLYCTRVCARLRKLHILKMLTSVEAPLKEAFFRISFFDILVLSYATFFIDFQMENAKKVKRLIVQDSV